MKYENQVPVITLDGPSGTGKGTICYLLAKHLHWNMLDSGAIYRVLAYAVRKKMLNFTEKEALVDIAKNLNLRFEVDNQGIQSILLDEANISAAIRTEQCGQDASTIAAIPEVRAALLERQRAFAEFPGLVTDGRDMGTVVFPDAKIKFFLYANSEERAKRRYLQLKKLENNVSLAQVIDELATRDARDSTRAVAPLKAAEDAIVIDTTGLTVDEVFSEVLKFIEKTSS